MIKKILVTGAGGYIGSVLVPMLLDKGYYVLAADKYFFGTTLKKNANLKIIKVDCRKINKKYFKDVYGVIDLVAISNDPSGELFKKLTWQTNYESRLRCAKISKKNGISRYLLPSSCSIYGFQKKIVNEKSKVNPLTNYAKANYKSENKILKLKTNKFIVTVLRQATIFGLSPRMRFDLAINGMTEGAKKNGYLPIMRNGKQIRPLCHVKDTCRLQIHLLEQDPIKINGEIFNVGSKMCTKNIKQFANIVKKCFRKKIKLKWYGDPDNRSYNVSFEKLKKIKFKAKYSINYGVREILNALNNGKTKKTKKTITLEWYKFLKSKNKFLS
jgi:nucleoside-diphosphate-sugar epimerase